MFFGKWQFVGLKYPIPSYALLLGCILGIVVITGCVAFVAVGEWRSLVNIFPFAAVAFGSLWFANRRFDEIYREHMREEQSVLRDRVNKKT